MMQSDKELIEALETDADQLPPKSPAARNYRLAAARLRALTAEPDEAMVDALGNLDKWLCQFLNCADDPADTPADWKAETSHNFEALRKAYNDAHKAGIFTAASPRREGWQSNAATDVLAERKRQIEAEGWTIEHDDTHTEGELARAGGIYAVIAGSHETAYRNAICKYYLGDVHELLMQYRWPYDRSWYKPTNRRRDLVKAAALIIAEIERLDRAALPHEDPRQ